MGIKDLSLIWGQCFLTADKTDSTLGIHPGGLRAMGGWISSDEILDSQLIIDPR
jgi:hypothetical protein